MICSLETMNKTTKTLLAVLIATLLGGGGYFYIKMGKKPSQPPINEGQKVEEIDTSNWQTYRNETLGFEIRYPKTWNTLKFKTLISFRSEQSETDRLVFPSFNIESETSNKNLEDFSNKIFGSAPDPKEKLSIAGLAARRQVRDFRDDVEPGFYNTVQEVLVIQKAPQEYFVIEFLANPDNIESDLKLWHSILETFKSIKN